MDVSKVTENTDFLVIEAGGKEVNYLNALRYSDAGIVLRLEHFVL